MPAAESHSRREGQGALAAPLAQTYVCSQKSPAAGRWAGLGCSQHLHHAGAVACGSCRIQQPAQQEGLVAAGRCLTRLLKQVLARAFRERLARADACCCRVSSASRRAGLCSSHQHSRHRQHRPVWHLLLHPVHGRPNAGHPWCRVQGVRLLDSEQDYHCHDHRQVTSRPPLPDCSNE